MPCNVENENENKESQRILGCFAKDFRVNFAHIFALFARKTLGSSALEMDRKQKLILIELLALDHVNNPFFIFLANLELI